jgi:single-strand selective monofunctional uracil DNA glycosylase
MVQRSAIVPAELDAIVDDLLRELRPIERAPPAPYIYNPLEYARNPYREYLGRYAAPARARDDRTLLLGMNPGPFGMAQTGVPFGAVAPVRDWLLIGGDIGRPAREHPKRPVQGFACRREEVSGTRLWGWARDTFGTPESFFRSFFVWNYCPLLFLEESGRNLPPDRLPATARAAITEPCDRALRRVVEGLRFSRVVGVGGFAETRARTALAGHEVSIGCILHPSPASPAANRGWAQQASAQLRALGVDLP